MIAQLSEPQFILLLGVYYNTGFIKSIEFKNEPIYEYTERCKDSHYEYWHRDECNKLRKIIGNEDIVYVNIFRDKIGSGYQEIHVTDKKLRISADKDPLSYECIQKLVKKD